MNSTWQEDEGAHDRQVGGPGRAVLDLDKEEEKLLLPQGIGSSGDACAEEHAEIL